MNELSRIDRASALNLSRVEARCGGMGRIAALPRMLVCLLSMWGILAYAQVAAVPDIDRAEELSWADSPAALQLLDTLQPAAQSGDALVQWLMVRGLAYADTRDEEHARAIIQRLHVTGATPASAVAAGHIVQASLLSHLEQNDRAAAELKLIEADATLPNFVRYRLQMLRGSVMMFSGQIEAALSAFEKALDLANSMHSVSRAVEAMASLSDLFLETRNLDRATSLAKQIRGAAQQSGDEILSVKISTLEYEIARVRGDLEAQRRALLEALLHAERTGSDKLMTLVLIELSDFHLNTKEYAVSLRYSRQALPLALKLRRGHFERLVRANLGMAEVGLGQLAQGKQHVDGVIRQDLASGDLVNADELMRQYLPALEQAGDMRGALDVFHRDDKVHDQLMTTAREKALLELSAKFDDERQARQIELLERDNVIKSRDLQAERLRQQMIVMAAALIALACGALARGMSRIRQLNVRLLHNSRHDSLTGLLNRRHFNQHILARSGDRPYLGCLLLVDLDHFQRINGVFGHTAGDEVLSVVSKRLTSALRDSDALVRWAGEEFLGMLKPMSEAQLNILARRLLTAVSDEPVAWHGQNIQCTVSIGCASFPVKGAAIEISLDQAITLVGKALQQAKRQGRDRACLITLVDAGSDGYLDTFNTRFEEITADRRVQLTETAGASG